MPPINTSSYQRFQIPQLLLILQESYVSLIPAIEKAKLPWRNEIAYDEWDRIADSLFDAIVINPVLHSLECSEIANIARYGFLYEDYSARSFFLITDSSTSSQFVFLQFITAENPFDQFICQRLTADYQVAKESRMTLPLSALDSAMISCFHHERRLEFSQITID